MKQSTALKTLPRAPLKSLLTFLLIAAASFALFSRVTDYAITTREAGKAESFYSGVAALDNSVPAMVLIEDRDGIAFANVQQPEDKPWPSKEQLNELSSLPGVTLTDTRYMTAGQVGDYKRLIDKDKNPIADSSGSFVLEGTYLGYQYAASDVTSMITLSFDDVKMLAGEIELIPGKPLNIDSVAIEDMVTMTNPYPQAYFDNLQKGSRCLVMGNYNEVTGRGLKMTAEPYEKCFRVLDGLDDNYLETADFSYYREAIDAFNQALSVYDIVYTSDMRAIPRLNERNMVIAEGHPLTTEDTDGCVVSTQFMETYHLSIGDSIPIKLGDKLFHQNSVLGAQAWDAKTMSEFKTDAKLKIIGAYRFVDDYSMRTSEHDWAYTVNTIFVPSSYLPVDVPADYEPSMGEFSIFIAHAHDIEAFKEAAEPLVAEMGLGLHFSDGGWLSMKDSFQSGSLTSFLTTVLYVAGAILALLLAVYLYIGRNKKTYAIMRTLGVSSKKAGNSVILPLIALSVLAIPSGGFTGLFYASYTAAKTLSGMATSAPDDYVYVLNDALPIDIIILCLFVELAFTALVTLLFLRKMKHTSPLELLQDNAGHARTKAAPELAISSSTANFNITTLPLDTAKQAEPSRKKPQTYSALRHVTAYILRHTARHIGKTAVSLVLTIVLTAGVGMFILARLTYQDAYQEMEVKGRALDFSSSCIEELASSELMEDFYCYSNFSVRPNGMELYTPMIFTNDFDRYLPKGYKIHFAQGYDLSIFEGTGPVCLLGQAIAKELNIEAGDTITLLSDNLYSALEQQYQDTADFESKVSARTMTYTVAGIIISEDMNTSTSIFATVNSASESIYGQPYPFGYCEFTLADNEKVDELNTLLEDQKKAGEKYAPAASFHIDAKPLENIKRVRDLLESLFPIAVAAAALIGLFGPGLIIIQSAQEAAFLRVLGTTKKRTRCMFVLEQIALCMAGIALVAGALALFRPELVGRSTETLINCFALYLLACICGTCAATIQVTRHKILVLLQVRE